MHTSTEVEFRFVRGGIENCLVFRRNAAETKIATLERNIKTLTVEIEELRALKIQLEGAVSRLLCPNLNVSVKNSWQRILFSRDAS